MSHNNQNMSFLDEKLLATIIKNQCFVLIIVYNETLIKLKINKKENKNNMKELEKENKVTFKTENKHKKKKGTYSKAFFSSSW